MKKFLALWFVSTICIVSGCKKSKPEPPQKVLVDIPALIGMSIHDVKIRLGESEGRWGEGLPDEKNAQGIIHRSEMWTLPQEGVSLNILYYPGSGKVANFYIIDSQLLEEDTDAEIEGRLLKMGNLERESPRYRIKFVPGRNKSLGSPFYGVKAIPQ